MNETFESWKARHEQEITDIRVLLKIPLSDEAEELMNNLRDCESNFARCQYLVAIANSYLDIAEHEALKVVNLTLHKTSAFEKDKMVAAAVTDVRCFRDVIQGLIDSINKRLVLGTTMLSYLKELYIKTSR
jgi:hypothetical protein